MFGRVVSIGTSGSFREVIPLELSRLRLKRTPEVITFMVSEVIGREGTKPIAAVVCIAVLTSLSLVSRESAIVQVQIGRFVVS